MYEGEEMEDGIILFYDCIIYNNINLIKEKLNLIERRKKIPKKFKIKEFINSIYEVPQYKTDGFIISLTNRNLNIKSKFITTVDLLFKNGYLLLDNENTSTLTPKDNTFNYKENTIYEFDLEMNLIKERKDKTNANLKFPYNNNPLYKLITGEGIYLLRCYHNYVKNELLKKLSNKKLLDIGSAIGGDINKWDKFEKIYAVDPNLNLRKNKNNIIKIKNKVELEYKNLDYDCVSIFFVPWNNEFINIINKAKQAVVIVMSKPINYECEYFSCKVEGNKIKLKIKESNTAIDIEENKIEKDINLTKIEMKKFKMTKMKKY